MLLELDVKHLNNRVDLLEKQMEKVAVTLEKMEDVITALVEQETARTLDEARREEKR
jgi:chaperonin cofactor prefoldin